MLSLNGYRRNVSLMCRSFFGRRGTGPCSIGAAVVADAVHRGGIVDHRRVVNVANVGDVHIVHRAVVVKLTVFPTSTLVALPEVTESVNDPAVETDTWAPVPLIENKTFVDLSPITRGPEETYFRSQHPSPRHPIVIVVIVVVGPVARRPDITFGRT